MKLVNSIALLLICGVAQAGEIRGRILKDSKPAGGLQVVAKVGEESKRKTTDNKTGSYRLIMKNTGTGTITVTFDGEELTAPVTSHSKSVRYNFHIVRNDQGKYVLKRR